MKIIVSKPVRTPHGEQAEFDVVDEATVGLFRGTKLPFVVDADTMRVEVNLEAAAFSQIMSNLLGIPPSYVDKMSLKQAAEVLKQALPLLPEEWRNSALASKMMSAI